MLILAQPLKVRQNGSDASLIQIATLQMAYYDTTAIFSILLYRITSLTQTATLNGFGFIAGISLSNPVSIRGELKRLPLKFR